MKKFSLLLLLFLLTANPSFSISLDEKIGQMIMVGFEGNSPESFKFKNTLRKIRKGEISGVILFSKNIKDKDNLIKMNEKILASSQTPPFIAIDNEGGLIQRHNFIQNKSAKEVSKLSFDEAKKEYSLMAESLSELKINLNFAPCVDLAINKNSIIVKKQRTYGENPQTVSKYAEIFINEHNKKKIATSIKHFPGHGSVKGDTHLGFVDATDTFKSDELLPYKNLKNYDKLNMVMVSHIYNSNIDKDFPASLSKKTIKGLLRNEIGFKGVVVSDDYDMGAVKNNYTLREIIVNSINAGVNIILFSNNIGKNNGNMPKKIRKIVKQEIKKGNINLQDIENSYIKIMALKSQL